MVRFVSAYIDSQTGSLGAIATYDEIADLPQFTKEGDQLEVTKAKGQPLETLQFVGGNQRANQVIGLAVGDSAVFAAGDFGVLDTHPDPEAIVPTFTGSKHLAIFYLDTDNEVDVVRLVGGLHNYIGAFGKPVALTVGAVDGYYIASENPIAAGRSGAKILAYNESGIPTFLRRSATRLESEGNAFTEEDFTGTNGTTSTNDAVAITDRSADRERLYTAYAVPSTQVPISGLYIRGFDQLLSQPVFDQYEEQSGGLSISGVQHQVFRSTGAANVFAGFEGARIEQIPTL